VSGACKSIFKAGDFIMAKKKTAQEIERDRLNKEYEERRERDKAARRANAEKQRRYKESMKAQGYKQKTVWVKPIPSSMVEKTAVIHESSLGVGKTNPDIENALSRAVYGFLTDIKKLSIPHETLYKDVRELLRLISDI
jgi:hypothetical protein